MFTSLDEFSFSSLSPTLPGIEFSFSSRILSEEYGIKGNDIGKRHENEVLQ